MNNVNIITPPNQNIHNQNTSPIGAQGNGLIPVALQAIHNANLNTPPNNTPLEHQDLFQLTPGLFTFATFSPLEFTPPHHNLPNQVTPIIPRNIQQNLFQTPPHHNLPNQVTPNIAPQHLLQAPPSEINGINTIHQTPPTTPVNIPVINFVFHTPTH